MREITEQLALVRLAGEVDLSRCQVVDDAIRAHEVTARHIVVDLGDVTFMDVAVANVLVRASERVRAQSRGLVLLLPVSAAPGVRRLLLELAPTELPVPVAPTYDAAIRALARIAPHRPGRSLSSEQLSLAERTIQARADAWRNCARTLELLALHDQHLVDLRDSLARCRAQLRHTG